jgi:hypothetical protein
MNPLSGFDGFLMAMSNFAAAYLRPLREADKRGEKLVRPTDSVFESVFFGFTEISDALDVLALTETLFGLAPPSKRIKKSQYLQFLIGAYLQEVYILEQRLKAYATKTARLYKIPGKNTSLIEAVEDTFRGIVGTRGNHVHSQRFSDKQLHLLVGIELISQLKDEFADDSKFEYSRVRADWKKRVKANNIATRKSIDAYCDFLFPHLTRDGVVFLPPTGRLPVHARKR